MCLKHICCPDWVILSARSICLCSIRCRMIFLPEMPKISEIKEGRRKPELCKNFSILFSGMKLPFKRAARNRVEIHSESRMSVFTEDVLHMVRINNQQCNIARRKCLPIFRKWASNKCRCFPWRHGGSLEKQSNPVKRSYPGSM